MSASSERIWKLAGARDLQWRWWDDQLVVYQPASGDTHLLNLVAGEVLVSLREAPARVAELADRMALRLALPPGERAKLLDEIETLLSQLDELGLVEAQGT